MNNIKKVILLKKLGRNEVGFVAYPSDKTGYFRFKDFEASPELVQDDPTIFKVIYGED